MWKLWYSMSPSPAGKFPKRNKGEIWCENAKRIEWGNCTWSKEVKQCMARGRGGTATPHEPQQKFEETKRGTKKLADAASSSSSSSLHSFCACFIPVVCLYTSPPLPLFTTSSFPHSHYPNPRKYCLLGKTYIIEKLLLPAFWRTFTELDFVAAGKEPKNKKELNNKAVKQKQLPNHKTITYKQQQQQQHIKRWL